MAANVLNSGWRRMFGRKELILMGVIHCQALPGTPNAKFPISRIVDIACREAEIYKKANVDAIIVENMHDIPYIKQVGPEIVTCMTRVCTEVRQLVPQMPCGVQVLAGANKQALAVASSAGFNFIRAEAYVFSHVADEGFLDACAGPLMRYRKMINAEDILVFADIKKKHSSHSITSDVSLIETAHAAEFFLCDGVIVTGTATGVATDAQQVQEVKQNVSIPVLVGSGVTIENLLDYQSADGVIVGSHFKIGGRWDNDLDADKVCRMAEKIHQMNNK